MRRLLVFALVPAFLLAAGTALAQGTPSPEQINPTVFVRQDPTLGPFLTDPAGMTLYLFTKDTTPGESTCNDACAENWPAFTADEPLNLPGGVEGTLTTITRADGSPQIAYNDIPLYYFANDQAPGDVTGQGVGDVWYVVAPNTEFGAVASPAASPAASPVAELGENEVAVTLDEFPIYASSTEFTVGETYTFVITNAGRFRHELVLEAGGAPDVPLEADGREAETEAIEPGATATLEWTFTEAGNYQYSCHFRDHYARGMALSFRVVE